jgi:hypothetical protein
MNFATIAAQLTADKPNCDRRGTHESVKNELSKHPKGLTVAELSKILNRAPQSLRITLGKGRGVYIKSWYKDTTTCGRWAAIWAAGDKVSAVKP